MLERVRKIGRDAVGAAIYRRTVVAVGVERRRACPLLPALADQRRPRHDVPPHQPPPGGNKVAAPTQRRHFSYTLLEATSRQGPLPAPPVPGGVPERSARAG